MTYTLHLHSIIKASEKFSELICSLNNKGLSVLLASFTVTINNCY